MTALAGVELESLVSEPDALTTIAPRSYVKASANSFGLTAFLYAYLCSTSIAKPIRTGATFFEVLSHSSNLSCSCYLTSFYTA